MKLCIACILFAGYLSYINMERVSNDKGAMSYYQIQDILFGSINMTPCNDLCWKAVSSGKGSLNYEMFKHEHRSE